MTDDTAADDAGEGAEGASDDAASADTGAAVEPQQTRKERRQNEFRAAQESAREAREELARERTAREELDRRVAEMDGRLKERDAQSERDRKDPREDKIKELRRVSQRHLEAVANAKDPARQQEALDAYHEAVEEAAALRFELRAEEKERTNPKQAQQGLAPREVAIMTAIEGEFPTFGENNRKGQEFRATADLHLMRLMAQGKPYGLATVRAACAAAASEMKIGGASTGSTNRGRYGASGAGDGAGGGGEGDRGNVPIGRQEEALAIAMANRRGKGETKEQAIAEWRKRVAPGVAKRMADE